MAIQIDLKKAFDRVRHETVTDTIRKKGVPNHLVAVLCRMWQKKTIKAKLNSVASRNISLHRGGPHGAPRSPLFVTGVIDELMADCHILCRKRGLGWAMENLWAPTVGYADDVIILSSLNEDGVNLLVDCTEISAELGLDVGMEKTNWTSTEPRKNEVLKIGKDEVKWSGSIAFLGTVLEFGGHDAKALQNRTGQETKKDRNVGPSDLLEMASSGQEDDCLQDCDRILTDWVGGNVALDESSSVNAEVLGSTHSGSGEGIPTSNRKRHGSLLEISSSRRTQTVGKIQCQLGVRAPLAGAQTASTHCKVASSTIPKIAIKTKPLAWWRFHQEKWTDKHSGLHPKTFECWR